MAKKIVSLFVALALMLAFTPAPSVQAQGVSPWTKHNIDIDFNGAWGIYVYDIDDDGNSDVVATAFTADAVVWYEAPDDPTGVWTRHDIDINLDAPFGVYVYDVDGDGNPDVIAAGFEADDVVWYEAPDDPTGTWAKHNIDVDFDGAWGLMSMILTVMATPMWLPPQSILTRWCGTKPLMTPPALGPSTI